MTEATDIDGRLTYLAEKLAEKDEPVVTGIEAQRFIDREAEQHPEGFHEWLEANAVRFATERLQQKLRSARPRAARQAKKRTFRGSNRGL